MQNSKYLATSISPPPWEATLLHRPQALPNGTVKDQPYLFRQVGNERVQRCYSLHKNTPHQSSWTTVIPKRTTAGCNSPFTPEPYQRLCPDRWDDVTGEFTYKANLSTATVGQRTTQASQAFLTTAPAAINGIYRRIKEYLQNYGFPGNEVAFVMRCVR